MNKFKISRTSESVGYPTNLICYCLRPKNLDPITCTICNDIVDKGTPIEVCYWEEDILNPDYQALRIKDYMYIFCSNKCREIFQLNPLVYE